MKTHFTKDEWFAVAQDLNPSMDRATFEGMWTEFFKGQDAYRDVLMADDPTDA